MRAKYPEIIVLNLFWFGLAGLLAFVLTQDPRFHTDPSMFGVSLWRGGYRSFYLSWSDGQMWDGKKLRHIHLTTDRRGLSHFKFGLRIWPKWHYLDLRRMIGLTNGEQALWPTNAIGVVEIFNNQIWTNDGSIPNIITNATNAPAARH